MDSSISALAEIIQIAVAPVFLLAGIAGFLNVMSGRLGRIVDRGRVLENKIISLFVLALTWLVLALLLFLFEVQLATNNLLKKSETFTSV